MKITVRKVVEKGNPRWCLDYTPHGGKRIRRFFATKREIDQASDELKAMQRQAGEAWLALTSSERSEILNVFEQIRAAGKTMSQVWHDYQNGRGNGITTSGQEHKDLTLEAAGMAWLKYQRDREVSEKHHQNCSNFLSRFTHGRTEQKLSTLTVEDIRDWLSQYDSPVSWNTYRNLVRAFYSFCFTADLLPENPLAKKTALPKRREDYKRPVILSPGQVQKALRWIWEYDRQLLAYFTLATMAGIRPEECDRMKWEMIDLDHGLIDMPAGITKDRRPRLVHLEPMTLSWLRLAKEVGAKLPWTGSVRQSRLVALRTHLGYGEWPHDIMRHTFGSNYVELHQSLDKTALEMGNSPDIIKRHYRELVRPKDCAAFWSLTPDSVLKTTVTK